MDSKNRFSRLSKRRVASSPPPLIVPTEIIIERSERRGGGRRRQRLWLLGALLWVLAIVGFVTLRAWRAHHHSPLPNMKAYPSIFPVHVVGTAREQVKDVQAVWVRQEQQGGQSYDLYEVRGRLANPKPTGDALTLEVRLRSGKTDLTAETFVHRVASGEEQPFALPLRDETFARERREDVSFVLTVNPS
ncbi:MAG: hypothetical protein NZT92_13555 [Abditibacteriales bacterium]|nr:hypothetical protein [Abditibacteriales bacterium]